MSAVRFIATPPNVAGLRRTGVDSGRLSTWRVRGAGIVFVDQLPSGLTDTNRGGSDDEGAEHGAQSQATNDWRSAGDQDKDGQNEGQTGRPHELLGSCLVPLKREIRHDALDPVLLTLARVHCYDCASEQQGLERNDRNPAAQSNPALPEGPGEAGSQGRDHKGESQGQVHDRGMQW